MNRLFCLKLILMLNFGLLLNCSNSEYTKAPTSPGNLSLDDEVEIPKKPPVIIDPVPKEPVSEEGARKTPEPIPGKIQYSDMDTGIPECFGNKEKNFRPLVLERNLDYYVDGPVLNLENLADLQDLILRQVVSPDRGLVDYQVLREGLSTQWTKVISALETLSPERGDYSQRLAYWINSYNFVMMNRIVAAPDATEVGELDGGNFQVFTSKNLVGGYELSLNQIEYWIFGLGNKENRPSEDKPESSLLFSSKEVRLHAALVCGANSCPRLRNFAYRSKDLEMLLTENFRLFLNTERHIAPNGEKVSALFNWFKPDFVFFADEHLPNIPKKYILEACRNDKSAVVEVFNDAKTSSFSEYEYDWGINQK